MKKYNEFIDRNGYIPEIFSAYSCSEVDDVVPTLTTGCGNPTNCGSTLVKEDIGDDYDRLLTVGNYMPSNHNASRVVDTNGIAPTVMANHGIITGIVEPFIVASRGRNPDNPSDRSCGCPTEQRLEANFSGCSNTLTSVQKDNYVVEPDGDCELKFVCGVGEKDRIGDGKQLSRNYPQGSRVYDSNGVSTALTSQGVGGAGGFSGLYTTDHTPLRIRKLTPGECWKLMGFTKEDQLKSAEFVSQSAQYKQAGNSIVTNCLTGLFSALFLENGYRYDVWTKYVVTPIENPQLHKKEKLSSTKQLF